MSFPVNSRVKKKVITERPNERLPDLPLQLPQQVGKGEGISFPLKHARFVISGMPDVNHLFLIADASHPTSRAAPAMRPLLPAQRGAN